MDQAGDLTPESLAALRHRFYDFYDGVVADVALHLRAPRTCTVTVHCMDREAASGWSAIRFTVSGVDAFRFDHGRFRFEVLSFGIQFVWEERLLTMVLAPSADDVHAPPDLTRNIAYVSGLSCAYEVLPL